MTDYTRLTARKIGVQVHPCESRRHIPEHPGMTCEDADEWIQLRDEWIHQAARPLLASRTPMADVPPALRGPNWNHSKEQ